MKMNIRRIMAAGLVSLMALNGYGFSGKWRGALQIGHTQVPLVFNFAEDEAGVTSATLDSPQQNATGIPLNVVVATADSINVTCPAIGAQFSGAVKGNRIEGVFSQRGYNFELILAPDELQTERRPQTPRPPYPYAEKDTFFVAPDGTRLAGTLTVPLTATSRKMPVVVMATGSGPQNRDEEIFEHRPFAVIADYLARNGIASLRYDDRGTAKSGGNYATATIDTFKEDLASAFRFAKSFQMFAKAGILGHSEGGTLAILTAAESKPDFIVSLAGMAVPAKQTLIEQNVRSLDKSGITGRQKEASVELLNVMFDSIAEQHRLGVVEPIDIDRICKEHELDVPAPVLQSVRSSNAARNGYFNSLVSLDPTAALRKIKCPVLAINGTKDVQVNADANLQAFANNVKRADIKRMDGLNHLLQHATTGEISEYGEIRETMAPEVLELITRFITRQAK